MTGTGIKEGRQASSWDGTPAGGGEQWLASRGYSREGASMACRSDSPSLSIFCCLSIRVLDYLHSRFGCCLPIHPLQVFIALDRGSFSAPRCGLPCSPTSSSGSGTMRPGVCWLATLSVVVAVASMALVSHPVPWPDPINRRRRLTHLAPPGTTE